MLFESPTIRKIHRISSLLLAAFVLFYTLTGLLLNHRSWFSYFIQQEKTISQVKTTDPSLLRAFIEDYKQQIGREDDPTVIRIRDAKTIEFLYGFHGDTTYIIHPEQGTMEQISKVSIQPWSWLNQLHKAFKTSNIWLFLADCAGIVILLMTISGLFMVRYRALEIYLVLGGVFILAIAASLA